MSLRTAFLITFRSSSFLKSTIGFLLLLVLAGSLAGYASRRNLTIVPDALVPQWRAVMAGFWVFLIACLASRLDIGIRHFMVPIVLLILMLAPLPNLIAAFPKPRVLGAITAVLVVACFLPILLAFPYFFSFTNGLALRRPVYYLLNDSNVTWNEALPAVKQFADERHLAELPLDWASLSDAAIVVPQARAWDCQSPTSAEAGKWVAVTAVSILENHECEYLKQYPHEELAGGAFYVFRLPAAIPPPGSLGGPPPVEKRRVMWGMPFDLRAWMLNVDRHPDRLPEVSALMARFQQSQSSKPK